jgi:hypothetical protein
MQWSCGWMSVSFANFFLFRISFVMREKANTVAFKTLETLLYYWNVINLVWEGV